jgi:hypothetical protein
MVLDTLTFEGIRKVSLAGGIGPQERANRTGPGAAVAARANTAKNCSLVPPG